MLDSQIIGCAVLLMVKPLQYLTCAGALVSTDSRFSRRNGSQSGLNLSRTTLQMYQECKSDWMDFDSEFLNGATAKTESTCYCRFVYVGHGNFQAHKVRMTGTD